MLFSFIDLMCGAVFALPFAWLFMAYCKNGSRKRFLLISLFTLYLCKMFDVVGIPAVQYFRWEPAINLIPFGDEKNPRFFLQLGLNAVMFMPFGFMLPVLWEKCRTWSSTLLAGFFTSLAIEIIQLFSFRATDVDDLIMNTLGTVVGFLLAKLIFRHRSAVFRGRKDWLELMMVNAIVLLTIVFVRYPLMEVVLGLLKI